MVQLLLPDADIAAGGWASPVFSQVDANDGSDSTIKAAGEAVCSLQDPVGVPDPSQPHILSYDLYMSKTGSTLAIRLYQGTTLIAEQDSPFTASGLRTYTLSAGEVAAITDYTDLRVAAACTDYGGRGATMRFQFAQLEVPEAPFLGSELKAWDGGAWVPGKLKRYDGVEWVPAQVQRWTGSAWEDVP